MLFVESGTEIGGAQMALLTMLRHLDRTRVEPFYVSLEFGAGSLPEQVRAMGIPVVREAPARFRNLLASGRRIAGLGEMVRRNSIDVVFSNSGHPLLFARPAAMLSGRPCVWWVHGYFPEDPMKGHWISVAERLLQADVMLANSHHTAGVLERVFPECQDIQVVHYGTDTIGFAPNPESGQSARQEAGLGSEEFVIGMFGRLHPFKGQNLFLRAAAQLRRRGLPFRFLLVGGTPFQLALGYPEYLRFLATELGLNGEVVFLGQRSDTPRWMNACDVLVHASVEPEPWGLVVSEGMACGRPVVAAAAGGPLEMIEHGRTGWLVPPNDPAALSDALEHLYSHAETRREIGKAARSYAEQHFNAIRAAEIFADVLCSIGKKHASNYGHSGDHTD